jgi:hypothetical protein
MESAKLGVTKDVDARQNAAIMAAEFPKRIVDPIFKMPTRPGSAGRNKITERLLLHEKTAMVFRAEIVPRGAGNSGFGWQDWICHQLVIWNFHGEAHAKYPRATASWRVRGSVTTSPGV